MWDSSPRTAPRARFESNVLPTRLRVGILIGNQNWSKLTRSGDVQPEIKLPWPLLLTVTVVTSAITEGDSYSVCEGEPLYQVCNKRAKFGGGCAMTRKPIQLLSSLNGIELVSSHDAVEIKRLRNDDEVDACTKCDLEREVYFKYVRPTGVSVTKWNFGAAGKQGELFVATLGGANTVYVDEDVYAGDTLIVDVPIDNDSGIGMPCDEKNPFGRFISVTRCHSMNPFGRTRKRECRRASGRW